MTPELDPKQLALRLRHRRAALKLTVRKAAEDAGVSAATFSRVERGDHLPDRENLLRLARWAGIRLEELSSAWKPPPGKRKARSTPEQVAVHLRADPKLAPQDASVLAEVFRSAYEALRKQRENE